jgi:predicted tellurium resistance membrane protein TerC
MLYGLLITIFAITLVWVEWSRLRRDDRKKAKEFKAMMQNKKQRILNETRKKFR